MDPVVNKALAEIYAERDRLEKVVPSVRTFSSNPVEVDLPKKRNLKQKFFKLWSSPNRWKLAFQLGSQLLGRLKYVHYLTLIFTFPAELSKLRRQLNELELQLIDQKLKLLQVSKALAKNKVH